MTTHGEIRAQDMFGLPFIGELKAALQGMSFTTSRRQSRRLRASTPQGAVSAIPEGFVVFGPNDTSRMEAWLAQVGIPTGPDQTEDLIDRYRPSLTDEEKMKFEGWMAGFLLSMLLMGEEETVQITAEDILGGITDIDLSAPDLREIAEIRRIASVMSRLSIDIDDLPEGQVAFPDEQRRFWVIPEIDLRALGSILQRRRITPPDVDRKAGAFVELFKEQLSVPESRRLELLVPIAVQLIGSEGLL